MAETKLLSDINVRYCNGEFGNERFTMNDLLFNLSGTKESMVN